MKIKELAAELKLTGKEVLEKAKAMGVEVRRQTDELSDSDAAAIRNTISKGKNEPETKVVRAKARKSDDEKTGTSSAPAKGTKKASIAMPEPKRTTKKATLAMPKKPAEKPAATKTAETVGGPKPAKADPAKGAVPRRKPVADEPKVSKAMLEQRIAREKAEAAKASGAAGASGAGWAAGAGAGPQRREPGRARAGQT